MGHNIYALSAFVILSIIKTRKLGHLTYWYGNHSIFVFSYFVKNVYLLELVELILITLPKLISRCM